MTTEPGVSVNGPAYYEAPIRLGQGASCPINQLLMVDFPRAREIMIGWPVRTPKGAGVIQHFVQTSKPKGDFPFQTKPEPDEPDHLLVMVTLNNNVNIEVFDMGLVEVAR